MLSSTLSYLVLDGHCSWKVEADLSWQVQGVGGSLAQKLRFGILMFVCGETPWQGRAMRILLADSVVGET